jgi:hypothetical protein
MAIDWKGVFKRIYKSKALRAKLWKEKASDLILVASFLEPEIDRVWEIMKKASQGQNVALGNSRIIGIYLMLVSFAVENMLKARLIEMNLHEYRKAVETNGNLPSELRSHDLYNLSIQAGLQITDAEEDLLRRLSRSAIWAGRYPVPLRHVDLEGQKYSDGDVKNDSRYLLSDRADIKNLVDKLEHANREE